MGNDMKLTGLPTRTSNRLSRIGLDLGQFGARAVQLRQRRGVYTLANLACVHFESSNSPEALAARHSEFVHGLTSGSSFLGRSVCVSLSLPDVEFHAIDIPEQVLLQSGGQASQAIRYELERLTTLNDQSFEFGHWALPPARTQGANLMAAMTPTPKVLSTVSLCAEGGLECDCVDASPAALGRFLSLLVPDMSTHVWGVLDLGCQSAKLMLIIDGAPVLVRVVGSGGREWTKFIAESLRISPASAEIHKRDYGVGGTGRPEASDAVRVSSLLATALRTTLTDMATEIKRSYEYVLGHYVGSEVGDLVLVGGGGATPGLPEYLHNLLGIQVRRASSYLKESGCRLEMAGSNENRLEEFAAAIGSAKEVESS